MPRMPRMPRMPPWMDAEMLNALVIIAVAGTALLAYKACNPDKRIDRFYQEKNKHAYRALKTSYVVLIAAVAFSGRYVAAKGIRALVGRVRRAML